MKKIISIITLFIAFGFGAKAQEFRSNQPVEEVKELSAKDLIYRDLTELEMIVNLTPELKQDFTVLLFSRNEYVNQLKTKSEKSEIFEKFGRKLMSALNDDQKSTLGKYPNLVKRLTTYTGN